MAKKKRKPSAAFMKPMKPSAALGAVIGDKAMPRTQVTKKLWAYIKRKKLQDRKNRRMINADAALKEVFRGKKQVSMLEVQNLASNHLKYSDNPPTGRRLGAPRFFAPSFPPKGKWGPAPIPPPRFPPPQDRRRGQARLGRRASP